MTKYKLTYQFQRVEWAHPAFARLNAYCARPLCTENVLETSLRAWPRPAKDAYLVH